MAREIRVALVGDFDPSVVAHQAIPKALELAGAHHGVRVEGTWIHTSSISRAEDRLSGFDGVWCVPASPYANTMGAIDAIRYARQQPRPFLGTCGGFQHALLEYAHNVLGMTEAAHGETDSAARVRLIAPLACSLVEQSGDILLTDGGRIREAYGLPCVTEGYHCSYGFNHEYESRLLGNDLQATARDVNGEVRGVELAEHPFYVGVLFQPERRALRNEMPPLVAAFVAAMVA
jgi:CTP synthase (UTP-ammonia lyase)